MAGKNTAVFGIYPTQGTVEDAVDALRADGFTNTDISVLFPENVRHQRFCYGQRDQGTRRRHDGRRNGAVVGGTLGWLAGIGALAIPALVHSSPPDRSWRPWRARVWAARSVAHWRLDRHGYPGIRSQALRGTCD